MKVNKGEAVAVLCTNQEYGTSLVELVMRFYDPEFGQVLVDGVNVKEYNIMDLRETMGLVSQEPTLFNYSVKDNILYGFPKATNKDILEVAERANVTEFIESDALEHAIMDDPQNLLRNMQSTVYKDAVIAVVG